MPLIPVDIPTSVLVGPCIDDTDFKTLETGIAYNAAGMSVDLFQQTGLGEVVKTDITPTVPGDDWDNDWTHIGNGVYELKITAAQNNIMGSLWVVGICAGVLVFESAVYTVIPLKEFNVVRGADRLEVDAHEIEGADATDQIASGYNLLASAGYSSPNLRMVTMLERNGQIITAGSNCVITVCEQDGTELFEIADAAHDANGVFSAVKANPGLTAGNVYYAKIAIDYGGNTYTRIIPFTAR